MHREQLPPPQPPPPPPLPAPPHSSSKDGDDNMPATSDFVKKLYKMLEDQSFAQVVSWGPHGDCFVVKDMNEFTKSILPRMFKHSNFASFVRQLNKYDFHKASSSLHSLLVKNTDDAQFGEHSWTFRHPDFHADRRDALENIKRKVPAARKSLPNNASLSSSSLGRSGSSGSPGPLGSSGGGVGVGEIDALQAQTNALASHLSILQTQSSGLERSYRDVLGEVVNFQRNLAQQDVLMQKLIQYFLGVEGGESYRWSLRSVHGGDG
ncbi:winged helix DNA-binding domain-containing protein [Phlebopus sp. FC_14]|nr:winged helix DNA-binding domain-containing protein [Phlebopus sp. FC_14]